MKFLVVSGHAPLLEGSASGRILHAYCSGLRSLGHDATVWYWGSRTATSALPSWCEWRPLPDEPWLLTKARALARPRSDVVRAHWSLPSDHIVVADDPVSFPAVAARADAV